MNRNFLEEAIASFDKSLNITPEDANIWYNRGKALQELGRFEEAVANFDRAIQIKPDQLDSWHSRGKALQQLGRIEEALTCFDKALEINADNPDIWRDRGKALEQLGQREDAFASFGKALQKLGQIEEAVTCFDKALEINADNLDIWRDRGKALQHLGRWEDAITSFDKTLSLRSNDIEARKCLRDLLSSGRGIDYIKLRDLLEAGEWKKADQETYKIMCQVAGRTCSGYWNRRDIDNLSCEDLRTMNQLWLHYSNGKFGSSVQKKIYEFHCGITEPSQDEINDFCERVGWKTRCYIFPYDGEIVDVPYCDLFDILLNNTDFKTLTSGCIIDAGRYRTILPAWGAPRPSENFWEESSDSNRVGWLMLPKTFGPFMLHKAFNV